MLSTPADPLLLTTRAYAAIMLPRLTIFSISPVAASGQRVAFLPVTFAAPPPYSCGFRPLPSGVAPGVSARPSAAPAVIEIQPTPLDAGSTRQVDRPPKVMRVTFIPYTRRIYSHTLPDGYRALKRIAFSPGCGCLICDSCSSGRDFACGFLQIPPRDGHPCRPAIGSHHQGPKRTCTSKSPIQSPQPIGWRLRATRHA